MASLDEGYAGGTESHHPANRNGRTAYQGESRLDEANTTAPVASPSSISPSHHNSEDSDEFEEVHYEASTDRPAPAKPPVKQQSPPTVTARFPPQRSLMESILPSDSESDSEMHVHETPVVPRGRKPSLPLKVSKISYPTRDDPAPPVVARDYGTTTLRVESPSATRAAVTFSPIKKVPPGEAFIQAPPSPSPPQNLYDTKFDFIEEPVTTIPNLPSISTESLPTLNLLPVPSLATLSPSSLVQDASKAGDVVLPPEFVPSVEQPTEEAQLELDSTLTRMEEEAFSSAMNAQISERVSGTQRDLSGEISSSKSDEEEVEQIVHAVNTAREMELDVDSDEDPEWERSPTPPPRRQPLSAEALVEAEEPPEYEEEPEFIREEQEELKRNLEREQEQYVEMVSDLTNKSLEDMRKDAEAELANARALRNQAQRNADGVTRAMATDIKVRRIFSTGGS